MLAPYTYPFKDPDTLQKSDLVLMSPPDVLRELEASFSNNSSSNATTTTNSNSHKDLSELSNNNNNGTGLIQDGSQVILFITRDFLSPIFVKTDAILHNKYGHFHHNDMIGLPYGSRVYSRDTKKGYIYLLKPYPELWTISCSHRTEILYHTDISIILFNLGIKPGQIVLESGTGSASLTTALVHTVRPTGRVYTFEYHSTRAKIAQEEFLANGLAPWVTCIERDIISDGFPEKLFNKADVVFLDLPNPETVVKSARECLKHNGRFASFSPCIEQVQETCGKLREYKFVNLSIFECLQRSYDVRSMYVKNDCDNEHEKLDSKGKKRSRLEIEDQISGDQENNKINAISPPKVGGNNDDKEECFFIKQQNNTTTLNSIQDNNNNNNNNNVDNNNNNNNNNVDNNNNKIKINSCSNTKNINNRDHIEDFNDEEELTSFHNTSLSQTRSFFRPTYREKSLLRNPSDYKIVSKPFPEMRGHTGYLIVARNYKLDIPSDEGL